MAGVAAEAQHLCAVDGGLLHELDVFGSVGTAATRGWAFLPIYIGPIIMMIVGFGIMTKIATVCREQNITSIADFLGSRYGKSQSLAALVAIIAVIGVLAYIALQLKAVSLSFDVLIGEVGEQIVRHSATDFSKDTAFYVTILMAVSRSCSGCAISMRRNIMTG